MTTVLLIATVIVAAAFVVAFIRLLLGPSLADRVVAMDLMATVGSGGICVFAMAVGQPILMDEVMVLSLGFPIGTIAFAYYLERRGGAP
jgi:multicomponent Na+:H+ antiporter subunit F